MNLEMFTTSILVGLITGWVAGIVMKDGGYGLLGDINLGLGGSMLGSLMFQVPEAEWFAMIVVGSAGAASVIFAQRKAWPALT